MAAEAFAGIFFPELFLVLGLDVSDGVLHWTEEPLRELDALPETDFRFRADLKNHFRKIFIYQFRWALFLEKKKLRENLGRFSALPKCFSLLWYKVVGKKENLLL